MKKILLIIILLFIPIFINASDIDKLYIDSEIDISGNLIVREVVDFANITDDPIRLYYKNEIDKKYEGTTIIIRKIGTIDNINSLSDFYDEDFYKKHVKDLKNHIELDDSKYINMHFKEKNIYYIEYIIVNLCVKYNDASELYYRYLYDIKHNIKEGIITLRLPMKSELFDTYVHSDAKVKAVVDKDKYLLTINVKDFKKENYLDARVLFDKDIFSININKDKVLDETILDKVKKQESSKSILTIILYVLITLIILAILSIIYCYIKIDITHFNIKNNKIDKNIKLLVLSDIHDRKINKRLVKIIDKIKPDYIIMSGDLIDGNYMNDKFAMRNIKNIINLFKKLKDQNVYYTFGNHETYLSSEMYKKYKKLIQETNINVLNNKSVSLSDNVRLSGIFYEKKYYNRRNNPITSNFIKDKLGTLDDKKYNIIVNHNPLGPEPFSDYGYDMMISGHVHGGIIRIPFALLSPEFKFFPKYSNGLYNIKNMKLIVSRGIGFSKVIPFRLNNPGHIMVINLNKE